MVEFYARHRVLTLSVLSIVVLVIVLDITGLWHPIAVAIVLILCRLSPLVCPLNGL